jgi:valyl-tRNA synthetase
MRERGEEGAIPFRNVLFHGLIRDAGGEKMTKSRGNVVDPLLSAGQYGADAFRFGLLTGATLGADQRYSDERLTAARNFANKLWNSARFALQKLEGQHVKPPHPLDRERLALEDQWILSRLEQLTLDVDSLLTSFQVGEAGRYIEDFLRNEFCDWYIEFAKVRLNAGDERPRAVLAHVLDHGLRLLHPIMPFVTEELWQALREHVDADLAPQLIVAWYPKSGANWKDARAEAAMAHVVEVNRTIRNLRAENRVEAGARLQVYLRAGGYAEALAATREGSEFTSRIQLAVTGPDEPLPPGEYAFGRVGDTEVALALPRVDAAAEIARLSKELDEAEAHAARLRARLANEQFRSRAPAALVDGVTTTLRETEHRIEGLRARVEGLRG